MALPCGTTGSLYPPFGPARLVGLTVKLPSAIALCVRLPSVLREPLKASVIVLEATTPVKLPTKHGPPLGGVRRQATQGPYFKEESTTPGDAASHSPAYPTHELPSVNAKL